MKPSDALRDMAAAEGFGLVPLFDPRLFTTDDSRVMQTGTAVFLDGAEVDHVVRAYIGADGWVDVHPVDGAGRMIVQDDRFAEQRRHGEVRIVLPNGETLE